MSLFEMRGPGTFAVHPVDRKDKRLGRPVYIRAASPESAEKVGKHLLRDLGQKGRFSVKASYYNPLNDPEMQGFVRRCD